MKRAAARGLVILATVIAVGLSSGCAKVKFRPTPPGPGVPYISNFRIEPSEVESGGQATLLFDFRDMDGDVMDVYINLKREVSNFTVATGIGPELISRGRYLGLTEGTAKEEISVRLDLPRLLPLQAREFEGGVVDPGRRPAEIRGTRVYEVFVVDAKGQVSNRLDARVTVR